MKPRSTTMIAGLFGFAMAIGLFHSLPANAPVGVARGRTIATVNESSGKISEKTSPASGTEDESVTLRLAQSGFEHDGRIACDYSALMISYLDEMPAQEVRDVLEGELREYRAFVAEGEKNLSGSERRTQKRVLRDMELLLGHADPKAALRAALETPCRTAVSIGSVMLRTTGAVGSILTTAITLPIRFVAKFGIGLFARKETPQRGASYAGIFGKSSASGQFLSVGYQAVRTAFWSGNPLTLAAYAAFAIDLQADHVCREVNAANPREVRFCRNYRALKNGEFKVTETGERLGVRAGDIALHVFDFRSDEKLNARYCEASIKKQMRLAKRARDRLDDQLREQGITGYVLQIVAPEIHGCTTLRIQAETEELASRIGSLTSGIIDGIAYSVDGPKTPEKPIAGLAPSPSPTSAAPDEKKATTDEELCRQIHGAQISRYGDSESFNRMRAEIYGMALNPERYSPFASDDVTLADHQVLVQELKSVRRGRNLVLLIAPTPEQLADYAQVEKLEANIRAKLKKNTQRLRALLLKSKNYDDCLARQEEDPVQYDEIRDLQGALAGLDTARWANSLRGFRDLNQALVGLSAGKWVKDHRTMQKAYRKAGKRLLVLNTLKLDWEVQELHTVNDVRRAVSAPDVAHVLIVDHANGADGKLVDSRMTSFPSTLFSWLSPSLQSLTLMTCHSKTGIQTYKLKEHFGSQASFHKLRFFGYVDSQGILNEKNQSDARALSSLLESVDAKAYLASQGTERLQTLGRASLDRTAAPRAICKVSVVDPGVKIGTMSLTVNSKFVGALYPGDAGTIEFEYPCDWVKPGKNTVFAENISLGALTTISPDMQVTVDGRTSKPTKAITRPTDGSVNALRYDWTH